MHVALSSLDRKITWPPIDEVGSVESHFPSLGSNCLSWESETSTRGVYRLVAHSGQV